MKTIEQLLQLSKNPYYKFSPEEEQVLNDFLYKKQEEESKKSHKKNLKVSGFDTRVTATDDRREHSSDTVKVRNVVKKTIPHVEESGQ
jgi:hypothetical protein